MRFSLRCLFFAILVVSIGVVALLNANRTWMALTHSALIVTLSLAIVAAVYCNKQDRAFAIGMAIVGWIYFGAVTLYPAWNLSDEIERLIYYRIATQTTEVVDSDSDGNTDHVIKRFEPRENEFGWVLDCLVTGSFGFLGGFIGVWFYFRGDASKSTPPAIV